MTDLLLTTSTLHTELVGMHIELQLQPGRYEVHVMARSANIVIISRPSTLISVTGL